MIMPLLATKLYLPSPRLKLVARPRLLARLDEALCLEHKLTLISASAGFGKTTLLSAWINSHEPDEDNYHYAWLSLDAGDNDPVRFWTYFIAALQTVQANIGKTALTILQSSGFTEANTASQNEVMLTALVNEIVTASHDFVLILDDYHVIENPHINEGLVFLLDHLPPQLHLVIATRVDPTFSIARLRARHQLTELRARDLLFTEAEAETFLQRIMELELSAEDVIALCNRTEGWVTGLQLAALSIQGQDTASQAGFVKAFTGSYRYILDYLSDEIIQKQTAEVRSFLMETAILDRLSGSLCNAVTGQNNGQETLETLEQANLFIVPLDNERGWYRYHYLFAEFLRAYAHKALAKEQLRELHRRAGAWLAQYDLTAEAIEQALLAGDFEWVAGLIGGLIPSMLTQGGVVTLRNWLDQMPSALFLSHPNLSIARAWILVLLNTWDEIDAALETLDNGLENPKIQNHPNLQRWQGMADVIRVVIANNRGDVSQAVEYARRALRRLSEENHLQRSVVMRNLGAAYELQGDLVEASQALSKAITLSQASDNLVTTLQTFNDLARLQVEQANLQGAVQLHQQALQWVETWGQKHHQLTLQLPNSGLAYLGLADIHREWHDLETAYKYATTALDLGKQWNIHDTIQVTYVTLARILHAQGDSKRARDAIWQATQGSQKQSPFASWTAAMQARFCLFRGDLDTAAHWIEQCNLPLDGELKFPQLPDEYASLVRVFLAQGQIQSALTLLDQMQVQAEATGRTGRMIEISVLYALAFYAQGDMGSAYAPLTRALILAEPAGYMRVFVDEGPALAKLLRLVKIRGVALEYIDRLLAAFPAAEATTGVQALQPGSPASLIEPLSERELQVLRLLSTGRSNQEIADELIVARGTVKKHLHNIFNKLGVRNRSQAILRAEELHLLK